MPSHVQRIALICLLVVAQGPAKADDRTLNKAEQHRVIREIISIVERDLFDPAAAAPYLNHLRRELTATGNTAEPDNFALHLHRGLQAVKSDGHLGIYGPKRTRIILGEGTFEEKPAAPPSQGHEDQLPFTIARPFEDVAVVTMSSFPTGDEAGDRLLAGLYDLPSGTLLIFDLRGNSGGDASLFRRIAGCLFAAPTPLFAIRWRVNTRGTAGFETVTRHAEPDPACAHLNDSPAAVLVDERTASVGELMPFILQNRSRAIIVGTTTYGASHAAEFYKLPEGFGLMLPVGRTFDPETERDWEGQGVIPDIVISIDQAGDQADDQAGDQAGDQTLGQALGALRALATCRSNFARGWNCQTGPQES